MKKENIIVTEKIHLDIPAQVIEELDIILLETKALGIHVTSTEILSKPIAYEASLVDFSPAPLLKIMEGYPSISVWDLKRRALAYRWFKLLPLVTRQDLYEAWYLLKFLCQEIENPVARVLGKSMAELSLEVSTERLEEYRAKILAILENPSAPNRIRNSLWKNYTHHLKKSGKALEGIKDPNDPSSMDTLLHELDQLENEAIKENIFFGTSPIIYRNGKE